MYKEFTTEEVLLDILRESCYTNDSYFKIIAHNIVILMGNVIGDEILKAVQDVTPMTYYGITYSHLYELGPNPYPDALMIVLAEPVFSESTIMQIRKESEEVKSIYLELIHLDTENQ